MKKTATVNLADCRKWKVSTNFRFWANLDHLDVEKTKIEKNKIKIVS